jgi:hypothetical protein
VPYLIKLCNLSDMGLLQIESNQRKRSDYYLLCWWYIREV